jgi:tRNA 2-thiouridine synthesizing protein E
MTAKNGQGNGEAMGAQPRVDEHGHLRDFHSWSAPWASAQAQADGIVLGPDHWQVIEVLRAYYLEYEIAPPIRALVNLLRQRFGDERFASRELYRLFPGGPARQACRYAGLPKPVSCI